MLNSVLLGINAALLAVIAGGGYFIVRGVNDGLHELAKVVRDHDRSIGRLEGRVSYPWDVDKGRDK